MQTAYLAYVLPRGPKAPRTAVTPVDGLLPSLRHAALVLAARSLAA